MDYQKLANDLRGLGHDAEAINLPDGIGWICNVALEGDRRLELGWLDGEDVGLVSYLPPSGGSDPLFPIQLDRGVAVNAQSWSDLIDSL